MIESHRVFVRNCHNLKDIRKAFGKHMTEDPALLVQLLEDLVQEYEATNETGQLWLSETLETLTERYNKIRLSVPPSQNTQKRYDEAIKKVDVYSIKTIYQEGNGEINMSASRERKQTIYEKQVERDSDYEKILRENGRTISENLPTHFEDTRSLETE